MGNDLLDLKQGMISFRDKIKPQIPEGRKNECKKAEITNAISALVFLA